MAFTLQSEIDFVNEALDYLGAENITLADQTPVNAEKANIHFEPTKKALLRSYLWPFAKDQAELIQIETLTVDTAPTPAAWSVDAELTGATSETTATVLEVTSTTVYVVAYTSGDWTDDEVISDGTNSVDCATGYPDTEATEPNHKWSYQYELPTDFLRLWNIYEDDGTDHRGLRWDRQGHRILTDYSTCNINYVKDISDPDDYDDLFHQLLVLKLAQKLLPAIAGTKSEQFKRDLRDDIRLLERSARTVAKQENISKGRSDWNLARRGSGTSIGNVDNE